MALDSDDQARVSGAGTEGAACVAATHASEDGVSMKQQLPEAISCLSRRWYVVKESAAAGLPRT